MPDLTGVLRVFECPKRIFQRHFRIDPVQLIQIDPFEAKSLQAFVYASGEILRPTIRDPLAGSRPRISAFGGDYQILWIGIKGFGDHQLACLGTVSIGSIDEIDTKFDGPFQNLESIVAVRWPTPNAWPGKPHCAKAKPIDGQISAYAKNRLLLRCR